MSKTAAGTLLHINKSRWWFADMVLRDTSHVGNQIGLIQEITSTPTHTLDDLCSMYMYF